MRSRPGDGPRLDVAVIGMACRLPGCEGYEELWALLRDGRSSVREVSAQRWSWREHFGDPLQGANKTDARWAGCIDDVDAFDARFFNMSALAAEVTDPQQRIVLELCWACLEDAGVVPSRLAGAPVGVFFAAFNYDYSELLHASRRTIEAPEAVGTSAAVIANRVSHFFDFTGPSALIDAACSGGLQAIHEAVKSLAIGESSLALAGGINLLLTPTRHISFSKAGMLSPTGACRPFDASADGYVRSEGAAVLMLKPLEQAVRDGDSIHGVIKGTAVNHAGRTHTLTYPSAEAQARVIREAQRRAGASPATISYVEAHGTGTPKGDPIEIEGLKLAFSGVPSASHTCAIGSAKSNLGHLEAAAGVVGVIKVLLSMQHRVVPRLLGFTHLNPRISLTGTPFRIAAESSAWEAPPNELGDRIPRRAGVSSFGFGGTNGHVVVEEAPVAAERGASESPGRQEYLVCLSGKSAASAIAQQARLAAWLSRHPEARLLDVSATLLLRREHFRHRVAFVARDRAELLERLAAGVAPVAAKENEVAGPPQPSDTGSDPARLAAAYLAGGSPDFSTLFAHTDARHLRLPTYAFERERFWIPAAPAPAVLDEAPPLPARGSTLLAPKWLPVPLAEPRTISEAPRVLVLGATPEQRARIGHRYPGAVDLVLPSTDDVEAIAAKIDALGAIDRVFWLAPPEAPGRRSAAEIIEAQRMGVLGCFAAIEALLRLGYAERPLTWTSVTEQTQGVYRDDEVFPTHAAVAGLVGTLARECPRWRTLALDVVFGDTEWIDAVDRLPAGAGVLAHRRGEWHRRWFVPLAGALDETPPYRAGGVYVIIGGAGGIGQAWSEAIIRDHGAHVVWIGRRPEGPELRQELDALAELGPRPTYIAADASDPGAMRRAQRTIRERHGAIHGVIHAAMVMRAQMLAEMTRDDFESALRAKVHASAVVAETFAGEALDFLLLFSSINAFECVPGHGSYAAACSFQDAFGVRLSQEGRASRVIDWGYWGSVGALAAKPGFEAWRSREGVGSIELPEAMSAVACALRTRLPQVAMVKGEGTRRSLEHERRDERLVLQPLRAASVIAAVEARLVSAREPAPATARGGLVLREVDALACRRLWRDLSDAGLLGDDSFSAGDLLRRGLSAGYARWMAHSLLLFEERGYVRRDDRRGDPGEGPVYALTEAGRAEREVPLESWASATAALRRDRDTRAQIHLLEATLGAAASIITGRRRATDVVFPGASLELVEGIYRDNAVADAFNDTVGEVVRAFVMERGEAPIRILEIGAGTGATTERVLSALGDLAGRVEEYCYTDVSPAFLRHGEEAFGGGRGFFRSQRFDVEEEVGSQGIAGGHYDLVLATNVLHATRDVRASVRHAKSALAAHGLMVLNELRESSVFAHLTFGLLEGWWRAEDGARLPGSPALSASSWRNVLEGEGLRSVFFLGAGGQSLGQHVIVAESDGVVHLGAGCREAADRSGFSEVTDAGAVRREVSPPAGGRRAPGRRPVAGGEDRAGEAPDRAHVLRIGETIREIVAATLRCDPATLDPDEAFADYGVDSITAVGLVRTLSRRLDVALEPTCVFDHTSIHRLAEHVARQITPPGAGGSAPGPSPRRGSPISSAERGAVSAVRNERPGEGAGDLDGDEGAIAIVGMSGRFAQARSPAELWSHLRAGRDLVTKVSRWDLKRAHGGLAPGSYCDCGALLDGIDEFDAGFFGVTPREAAYMDPQQRLFLQEAWHALEDAGCLGRRLSGHRASVYVGCQTGDYEKLFGGAPPAQAFWGNHASVIAGRIAYRLDLTGPAVAVDTACSSSLVAVHLACQSLRQKESDLALAGGVFVLSTPDFYVKGNRAKMLSPRGRCFTFDSRADGFVPGEGAGAVVLKRLADALRDGDRVRAVIRGSGVNQDGASNGITAPSGASQQRLAREVFERFSIDIASIGMVEAHGTGTPLGDPIEYGALKSVFSARAGRGAPCALGSIKTNLGHAGAAAGIAGLLKAILSLEHGEIPASLHFQTGNPHIDFGDSPFVVPTELRPWPEEPEGRRTAVVSAFGFSGTNAMLVLQEASFRRRPRDPAPAHLFIVSARSQAELAEVADALLTRCERDASLDAGDVSYTLLCGRAHFGARLAVVAADRVELSAALRTWRERGAAEGVFASNGVVETPEQSALGRIFQASIEPWAEAGGEVAWRERLAAAGELWTQGHDLDFRPLFRGRDRWTVSLPTYPFARQRHWVEGGRPAAAAEPVRAEAAGHPLIHARADGPGTRFESRFDGRELVLAEHRIRDASVFAGTALLEMVHAAFTANPGRGDGAAVRITNAVWSAPLVVRDGEPASVQVELTGPGDHLRFEVAARAGPELHPHFEGYVAWLEPDGATAGEPKRDLEGARAVCSRVDVDGTQCRAAFLAEAIEHGPSFSALRRVQIGRSTDGMTGALATLILDPERAAWPPGFVVHPGMLDSALQAAVCVIAAGHDGRYDWVPFAVDEVQVWGGCAPRMVALIEVRASAGGAPKVTLDLCDEAGNVRTRLLGLTFRRLPRRERERFETFVARLRWESEPSPAGNVGGPEERALFVCGLPAEAVEPPSGRCTAVVADTRGSGVTSYVEAGARLLELIQTVARAGRPATIQLVTSLAEEPAVYSGLFGMLRSAAREYPALRAQLVEVGPGALDGLGERLAADAASPEIERVSYDDGVRRIGRWTLEGISGRPPGVALWRDGGVYLIAGAGSIARRLAEDVAGTVSEATLVLAGRSAPDAIRASRVEALRRGRIVVEYRRCDVARESDVVDLVHSIEQQHGPLRGVLHLAGVREDRTIAHKDRAEVERVMAPKVAGLRNLDLATRALDLDFFLLFSSISAELGNAGQADYAAANGFLQAYARYRNRLVAAGERQGHTLSIAWPLWRDGGMQVDPRVEARLRRELGIVPMPTADALAALRAAWASQGSDVVVLHGVRAEIERVLRRDSGRPAAPALDRSAEAGETLDRPGAPEDFLPHLIEAAALVCRVPPAEIDPEAAFEDYGVDHGSLHELAAELLRRGIDVPLARCLRERNLRAWAAALSERAAMQRRSGGPVHSDNGRPAKLSGREIGSTPRLAIAERSAALVREVVARTTGLAPEALDERAPFFEMGVDSLIAVELTAELEKTFGALPKTLFFECRNLAELSRYFAEQHAAELEPLRTTSGAPELERESEPARPSVQPGRSRPAAQGPEGPGDVAVVGLAGRYPRARDVSELWENLCNGADCITEVPGDRWDHARFFDPDRTHEGKTYCKWGGFLDGVDELDPLFFNISPRDAEYMDPQERLFLQCAYEAIEDAGYAPRAKGSRWDLGRRVGVFVGVMYQEYQLYGAEETLKGRPLVLSGSASSIANRVSYCLDFVGPSMTVDSMCSASLSALHLGCQAIRSGDCDAALVGGVNVSIHVNKYLMLARGNYASRNGRCESFGRNADGYVPGEGVGAVLLKPLAQALADGDHVYGIVRATAVNHGGKTSGYTVPSPVAQAEVIRDALSRARLDARRIGYVEAHGTGTSLGDPIEIAGLQKAFSEHTRDTGFCALGSIKSNIGHCESAAGVAGLTKVLLQIRHGKLVPSLHAEEANPNIDFERSPFRLQRLLTDWPRQRAGDSGAAGELPRVAALSSFGAGGSNAHAIIEEHVASVREPSRPGPCLFVFSAKRPEQLRELGERHLVALEREGWTDGDLPRIAFTLQVGRDALEERFAFVATTVSELKEKLRGLAAGEAAGSYRGSTRTGRSRGSSRQGPIGEGEHAERLRDWVQGGEVDWPSLYGGACPGRVSLPTYPFARERYWFEARAPRRPASDGSGAAPPRVTKRPRDSGPFAFRCRLEGDEPFFADHVVRRQRLLPGAVLLELARAAMGEDGARAWRFSEVAWLRPIVAESDGVEVGVALHEDSDGGIEIRVHAGDGAPAPETEKVRGKMATLPVAVPPTVDREAIARDLRDEADYRELDGRDVYARFETMGIDYGPVLRSVVALQAGGRRGLAEIHLQGAAGSLAGRDWTDARVLDAALQAAGAAGATERPLLPFACQELILFAPCGPRMWVAVSRKPSPDGTFEAGFEADLDVFDRDGRVCIRARGLRVRPAPPNQDDRAHHPRRLAPVWSRVEAPFVAGPVPSGGPVVVVGGSHADVSAIEDACAPERLIAVGGDLPPDELTAALAAAAPFERLVWIAPAASPPAEVALEAMISSQQRGVVACLRTIKALDDVGLAAAPLRLTFVTTGACPVTAGEVIDATHAGVHGFVGALAQERPSWSCHLADVEPGPARPWGALLSLSWSGARSLACRGGVWYRHDLVPCEMQGGEAYGYRRGGVYVVIGGAGGVGGAWTEMMVRSHGARVVWIGRRPLDDDLRGRLDALAALGPRPSYLQADATDRGELERARAVVLERYGTVHGVVHSAVVLRDQSIANMGEADFVAALAAKVDVSVRIAQVFESDALDFVLFFSSMISFTRNAGQSNYAAGCTFADAFAHQLRRHWARPVKVINWGYFGSVGAVATDRYRQRMQRDGIGSIEPAAANQVIDELLAGPLHQLGFIAATLAWGLEWVRQDESLRVVASPPFERSPAPDAEGGSDADITGLLDRRRRIDAVLDPLIARRLWGELVRTPLFEGDALDRAQLRARGLVSSYLPWMEETLSRFEERGYLEAGGTGRWIVTEAGRSEAGSFPEEWDRSTAALREEPLTRAHLRLMDATLSAVAAVVTGRRRATEVVFPGSSLELVEGIYRDNPVADYFNDRVADVVRRHLWGSSRGARVLEIGAGTGGTTARVLRALAADGIDVEEYCYTDVSSAFLSHGEEAYGRRHPYARFERFDVEQGPMEQGIALGHYDVVIAANVLHATRRIREAVRNAKAVMARAGLLVLNELSRGSLFGHVTFGLLQGWWLPEDTALRLRGNPGLSSESWGGVLADEGFPAVSFPVSYAHGLGQQVVVAASDGVIRVSRATEAGVAVTPVSRPAQRPRPQPPDSPIAPAHGDARGAEARTVAGTTISRLLSKTLKVDVHFIDPSIPFAEYGLDSITGVNLVRMLNDELDLDLESIAVFDHPSVSRLADYIASRYPRVGQTRDETGAPGTEAPSAAGGDRQTELELARSARAAVTDDGVPEPIAIIGCSGRFAGARDLDDLWAKLLRGEDLTQKVERWDLSRVLDGAYCERGGLLEEIDRFDPSFFNISGLEASNMDPQQRLFLEEAWRALEDAGYVGAAVDGRRVGVYVGCNSGDYRRLLGEAPAQAFWGNSASITPARIAYLLNLRGPAVAVDTACSSSLVALHLACQALWGHETDLALAGGVYVQSTPDFYISASKAGMLSLSGHSHAFDERADGFVPGEGVGVVVLKRLGDAIAAGDHIDAVVRGTGINQDGTSNGITAPSVSSQEALETSVYERFGVRPDDVQLVEAHGTGTQLGDPIEVEALTRAFRRYTSRTKFCAIRSVKASIGHAITAAGVAGLLELVLALKHRTIPPSRHYRRPNPNLRLDDSPFFVNTEPLPWSPPDGKRRCGVVSSFGFSGTNAHAVIEEAPPPRVVLGRGAGRPADAVPWLFVLSARTEEQLGRQVERLRDDLDGRSQADLPAVSHTLLTGRKHFEHRLAVVASTVDELRSRLASFLAHGPGEGLAVGREGPPSAVELSRIQNDEDDCIESYLRSGSPEAKRESLSALAGLFVAGGAARYAALFADDERRRVSLPTYPFSRERYWAEEVTPYPRGRDGQREPSGEWLFCREEWVAEERSGSVDWKERLAGAADQTIWVLSESERERTETLSLLDRLYDEVSLDRRPRAIAVLPDQLASGDVFRATFPDTVLFLADGEGGDLTESPGDVKTAFLLSRGLMTADWSRPARIHCVYDTETTETQVYREALAGFAAAAMEENPLHAWNVVARVAQAPTASKAQLALREWLTPGAGDGGTSSVLRVRGGHRERRRLVETRLREPSEAPFRAGGTYVIAGGFGPVGVLLCRRIARERGATLVVLSRAPKDGAIDAECEKLRALGGRALYRSVDVNDRDALERTMAEVRREVGSIDGVIHLARLVDDDLIVDKDFDRFARASRAKVTGTLSLDAVTRDDHLELFVLFSSMAAFGIRGSADYGYAAAFQNAFSRFRARLVSEGRRSGKTVALCWGPWAADRYMPPGRHAKLSSLGLCPIDMDADDAFAVICASIAGDEPVVGLMAAADRPVAMRRMRIGGSEDASVESETSGAPAVDVEAWLLELEDRRARGLAVTRDSMLELLDDRDLEGLSDATIARIYSLCFAEGAVPRGAAPAVDPGTASIEDLMAVIRDTTARVLMVQPPGPHEPFQRFGMDSVGAVSLAASLGKLLGILVEPRWLLDHSSCHALAVYIRGLVATGACTNERNLDPS